MILDGEVVVAVGGWHIHVALELASARVDVIREGREVPPASNDVFVVIVIVDLRVAEVGHDEVAGEQKILRYDEFAGARLAFREELLHLQQPVDLAGNGERFVDVDPRQHVDGLLLESDFIEAHSVFDDELFSTRLLYFLFGLFLLSCVNSFEILRDADDFLLQIVDLASEDLRCRVNENAGQDEVGLLRLVLLSKIKLIKNSNNRLKIFLFTA